MHFTNYKHTNHVLARYKNKLVRHGDLFYIVDISRTSCDLDERCQGWNHSKETNTVNEFDFHSFLRFPLIGFYIYKKDKLKHLSIKDLSE